MVTALYRLHYNKMAKCTEWYIPHSAHSGRLNYYTVDKADGQIMDLGVDVLANADISAVISADADNFARML